MKPMHIVEAQQVLHHLRSKEREDSYTARAITTLLEYLKRQEEDLRMVKDNVSTCGEIQWER